MRGLYIFTFKGIPVGANPMYLLLMLFLGYGTGSWSSGLIFALCATVALLVHEFGHALVAKRYDLAPQVMLHGFGGLTFHQQPKTNAQDLRITAAGPALSLLLGAIFLALSFAIPPEWLAQRQNLQELLSYSIWVNLGWGIFNLIPVIPMDGGKLLLALLKIKLSERKAQITSGIVSLVFGAAALIAAAYFKSIFMIFIIAFMVMMNINTLRALFSKKSANSPNAQADIIYEQARVLARNHEWQKLETIAQQMKRVASGSDQIGRAYELLVIANTNLKNYEEALDYARFAPPTEAVKQATLRCQYMLQNIDN